MSESVLVTGGCGFIGRHVVQILRDASYDVWIIDDNSTSDPINKDIGATHILGNICNSPLLESLLKEIKFKAVFHLAALPRLLPSFKTPLIHHAVNASGTIELLASLLKIYGSEFIFINSSSSSIYGDPTVTPTTESTSSDPLNPYALQKLYSEKIVSLLCDFHSVPYCNLRYFNPYGPGSFKERDPFSAYSSVIGIWENRVKKGKPLVIFGTGRKQRDFIHVQDVAQVNIDVFQLLSSGFNVPKFLNVGTGTAVSLIDVAQMFKEKFQCEVHFEADRPSEASITLADVSALRSIFPNFKFKQLAGYIWSL